MPPTNLVFIDFETAYSTEYSLTRLTEKQYVTDPRFKVFGAGVAVNDDKAPVWLTGSDLTDFIRSVDWRSLSVVGHNLNFDSMILTQHYGVDPGMHVDTLGMARAVVGTRLKSLGLDSLGHAFGIGGKMDGGKALADLRGVFDPTPEQLARLGHYCADDVKLTRTLFNLMARLFPESEYDTLDWTIRMAVNPRVLIDPMPLTQLELEEQKEKAEKLAAAQKATGCTKTQLSSNPQFAALLTSLGVTPPTKTSKTTGKETYAFAKSDEAFLDLLDHPDDRVHDVVAARLSVKSTIKESRAAKLKSLSGNGPLPVILKYSGAAQTHRLSGGGGLNLQNFTRGSLLRKSIVAPDGMLLVAADLSQIELRGNCKASGQTDILDTLSTGGDVYMNFARQVYGDDSLNKKDNPQERTVGKVAELSLGYYSGAPVFKAMLRAMAGIRIDAEEAQRIVRLYRRTHQMISGAWRIYGKWIEIMAHGEAPYLDNPIDLPIELLTYGFRLPSGLEVTYPGLTRYDFENQQPLGLDYQPSKGEPVGWAYRHAHRAGGYAKLHAGVLNNNLIQSVCRDIIMDKTRKIRQLLPDVDPTASVVMSIHDEVITLAQEDRAQAVLDMKLAVMKEPVPWWPGLPVDAEGAIGKSYYDCK